MKTTETKSIDNLKNEEIDGKNVKGGNSSTGGPSGGEGLAPGTVPAFPTASEEDSKFNPSSTTTGGNPGTGGFPSPASKGYPDGKTNPNTGF